MKKKLLSVLAILLLVITFVAGCGKQSETPAMSEQGIPTIDQIKLGEDYKDLKVNITVLTFRTDIMDKLNGYAEEFRKMYPGINVTYEGVDDYEASVLVYLNSNTDWGDIMMIPVGLEKNKVGEYFIALGTEDVLSQTYNYTGAWAYDGNIYGLASTGNANGLMYNKKVFEDAGISDLPKTPEHFMDALSAIRKNTDAIPLYTNYADEWPMSCWDAYMGINATGDPTYINQVIVHTENPFADNGDGTHPYAVYKILYDAVNQGLTEEDYTTTSEALSYGMLNNGEIGVLAFPSWGVVQAMDAGEHPEDVGFMPFPITVDGKQYVSVNGDYSYGINKNSTNDEQIASMIYMKWLIHESGYDYGEGGLAVLKSGKSPEFYSALSECEFLEDIPALAGEETFFGSLNTETGLLFNANGNAKGQDIVEHAFLNDKSFDEIMNEWNERWTAAQKKYSIEISK